MVASGDSEVVDGVLEDVGDGVPVSYAAVLHGIRQAQQASCLRGLGGDLSRFVGGRDEQLVLVGADQVRVHLGHFRARELYLDGAAAEIDHNASAFHRGCENVQTAAEIDHEATGRNAKQSTG